MNKRRISLGFNIPKSLESRVIYVTFSAVGHDEISAIALSDTPFKYTTKSMAGIQFSEFKKNASTYTGDMNRGWERPYKEFLQELVQLNDGEIDYYRLIEEGVSIDRLVGRVTEALKEFSERYKPK